jgi:DNA-binding transcriptional ArsR family regulator
MASADLLLHPVRLRIIKAFLGDRALTTAQLAAELADVPPGSRYRHLARLTQAGILQVVAERRIRGAVERTYGLRLAAAQVGIAEAAAMDRDQHAQPFMAFVAGLVVDSSKWWRSGGSDCGPHLARDGVSYRGAAMWLTDAELGEFLRELATVVQPRLANPPTKSRRRQLVYSVFLPGPEIGEPPAGRNH